MFQFLIFICRSDKVASEIYDQSLQVLAINHSDIYNAMIYPFTRMVIYGAIWYQGKIMKFNSSSKNVFDAGESNTDTPTRDKYSCEFSKMIDYWRQIWNQRTDGNTDIQFPFGFVQVCLINCRSVV